MIHDGLIHQRIKVLVNSKSVYIKGLRLGHLTHHVHDKSKNYRKEDDVCYGMFWVPYRFFKEAKVRAEGGSGVLYFFTEAGVSRICGSETLQPVGVRTT